MSFITGCAGKGYSLTVLAQVEDDEGESVEDWRVGFWRDGEWRSELELEFKPVAIAPSGDSEDAWAVLGVDGEVLWIEATPEARIVRRDRIVGRFHGAFTAIRPFGPSLAAAQMSRQVYWSVGGDWTPLGVGIPDEEPAQIVGVEALVALGDDLYTAGWGGEIWYLKNGIWVQVQSPTNSILTGAAALPSGEGVICGRMGTILRGRRERWAVLDAQQTDEDFWSVVVYQGKTYLSSMRGIYELVNDTLVFVDDELSVSSYYHLSANERLMVSIGAHAVAVTRGEGWQQIA